MMPDLWLEYGGDLVVDSTGDLALANGADYGEQRVLRRLLSNSGSYIWNISYGAGLGQFVGQPGAPAAIAGVVRPQLRAETVVARNPAPVVNASAAADGVVTLTLRYVDQPSGLTTQLTTTVTSS